MAENVACPSSEFSNCQDVTASIGIYLSAVPVVEGTFNSSNKNKETITQVDPSTMTKELLAFQESFKAAIANNELQEAIRQDYSENHDNNIPTVVIVTDTINDVDIGAYTGSDSDKNDDLSVDTDDLLSSDNDLVGSDDKHATSNSDSLDNSFDPSTNIDISLGEATIPPAAIAASEETDGFWDIGIATGGVIATVVLSLLLVSFIALRKRRRGNERREEIKFAQGEEKFEKHGSSRHSNVVENHDDFDQSGQKLLGNADIAYNMSDDRDEEEGFTGRTMRTAASESIHTAASHDMIVQMGGTSFASYGLGNNVKTETTIHRNRIGDSYASIGKNDDDNVDDYVLGEDDDSDSSVRQQLLSVSKSSESGCAPSESQSPTSANDVPSNKSTKENIISNTSFSSGLGDTSSSLQNFSRLPSSQSPLSAAPSSDRSHSPLHALDVAITNNDLATLGATAEDLASNSSSTTQPAILRRAKIQDSSPSSINLSNFSQKEEELDRLIKIVKFNSEGVNYAGAIGEDASRSCRSRASTLGSDANDSYASTMGNSSEGRSTSMGRSVTTSASQKERLEEIRSRVTLLVRDVAPDEEANINEMMIQFKGREEDLLETLLNMKERILARKARIESQKIARRNTRPRDDAEDFESPAFTQYLNSSESATEVSGSIYNESNSNTTMNTDGVEELILNEEHETKNVDHDEAAAAAAAWAIQRSLDEMMEKNEASRSETHW